MKTAFCIVTRNHGDVLLHNSPYYFAAMSRLGFDIYIYDSSDDDMTKNLVLAWNAKGFQNIYWLDCRFTTTAEEKVLLIYQQAGFQKEYDYVWLSKDRMAFDANYLSRLCQAMESKPDVILAAKEEDSYHYSIPRFPDVYSDAISFFRDFGATTTDWVSVILRTSTMLAGVDFDLYSELYNLTKENPFVQPVFLFARLAELSQPLISIVRPKEMELAAYVGTSGGWRSQTMELWAVKWPRAIQALPGIYDAYKDHVIKTECMHENLFASVSQLLSLSKSEYLTKDNFEAVRQDWENLSDIPVSWVDNILNNDIQKLCNSVIDTLTEALSLENYSKALWLFLSNHWINELFSEADYQSMARCMEDYQKETVGGNSSSILSGVHSLDDLLKRGRSRDTATNKLH